LRRIARFRGDGDLFVLVRLMQRVRAGMRRRRRIEMLLAEYQRRQQGEAGGNSYGFHKPDYIQGAGSGSVWEKLTH